MKSTLLSLGLLFALAVNASAQTNPELGFPLITNYSYKMYKGHSQVWSVIQDDSNLMFFGTTSGITSYDGVNWSQIKISGINKAGTVRALTKSRNGTIYYGGAGCMGYLDILENGETKAISLTDIIPEANRNFSQIWSIRIVGSYIYFQAREYIFRIEENSDKPDMGLKVWGTETGFAFSHSFGDQYFVSQVDKGLFKLLNEELTLVPDGQTMVDKRIYTMLPLSNESDGSETYLIGTMNNGFYKYDGEKFTQFKTDIDPIVENKFLYRGIILPDGNILVSVIGEGAIKITPEGKFIQSISLSSGLQDPSVYALYLDNSGIVWTGLDNGISKIDLTSPITLFSKQLGLNAGVLTIERSNGTLFVGTPTGAYGFNKSQRQFEFVNNTSISQIFMLKSDEDFLLIPGNDKYGVVNVYNSRLNTLVGKIKTQGQPNYFYKPKNKSDKILYGASTGIGVLKRSENRNEGLPFYQEGFFETGVNTIWSIAEDNLGHFWGGTQTGIVYRIIVSYNSDGGIDFENSKIETFGEKNGLSNSNGVVFGAAGKIYAMSEDGIMSFNDSTSNFEPDDVFGNIKIDFSSTDNFSLIEDAIGRVWIGTNNKITLAIPNGDGEYILEDELFNSYPFDDITVIFPEDDGTVWVGNSDGLVRMEGNAAKKEKMLFSVLLRQAITKTDTLSLNSSGNLELKQSNNSLRFMYAAPFFEQEDRTVYKTYLEGFDPDWTDWGNNSYKEYTNLSTGTYTFRVRAKNLHNVVSDEATFSFTILPPWYATWWAYLIYALLFAGVITAIVKWRSQKLKAENRILEERVNERTAALEKSISDLKSTQAQLIQSEKMASLGELTAGIAHEIQNPLNFVNNFSEVSEELIEEIKESRAKNQEARQWTEADKLEDEILDDIKQNLEKIHHHGKRAEGIVKGMLAHSRTSAGEKEPTDINALADEYLRLSFHGLRARDKSFNADFKTNFDLNLPKVNVVPQDIGRVLLNLINNAFQACGQDLSGFQNLTGLKPLVTVSTSPLEGGRGVQISISDNGPGIPDSIKDKIFQPFFTTKPTGQGTGLGLSLSYDIVKAHGGEIKVETKEGEGTEFTIQLPSL
ncbi:His Kinase A (phospho-acceptor) domain-containing protein [Aquiflexum balticum DSM 16537]|uniref:histidine kinase n=1 Tax=Aquiflexum balticum DSM 16537 TaxID=758820 RepID=A0A1W2H1T7_9BACT|nr:sensor histidine kinase [Aquiflexum balticum]SMD42841.1 His Kinase A (phospho-acceptor) domain-containing protein [Aquiflexum balticum DSM 16537]